jgi:hypothetical protein
VFSDIKQVCHAGVCCDGANGVFGLSYLADVPASPPDRTQGRAGQSADRDYDNVASLAAADRIATLTTIADPVARSLAAGHEPGAL